MTIEQAIYDIPGLGMCDAERLGDQIRDHLIDVLWHDPGIPPRRFLDWVIVLADARQRIVDQIHHLSVDRVDRDAVFNELRDYGLLDTEYVP